MTTAVTSTTNQPPSQLVEHCKQLNELIISSLKKPGNIEKLLTYYTPDVYHSVPSLQPLRGRNAVKEHFLTAFAGLGGKSPILNVEVTTHSWGCDPNLSDPTLIYEVGEYTTVLDFGKGLIRVPQKFIRVYKQMEEKDLNQEVHHQNFNILANAWKQHMEAFNLDQSVNPPGFTISAPNVGNLTDQLLDDKTKSLIQSYNQKFCQAFQITDIITITNLYSSDAYLLLPGHAILHGLPSIEKYYKTVFNHRQEQENKNICSIAITIQPSEFVIDKNNQQSSSSLDPGLIIEFGIRKEEKHNGVDGKSEDYKYLKVWKKHRMDEWTEKEKEVKPDTASTEHNSRHEVNEVTREGQEWKIVAEVISLIAEL